MVARVASLTSLFNTFGGFMTLVQLWEWQTLWSQRAPNYTETQKESKRPNSDSKVTPRAPRQSDPKVTRNWLQTPFWVIFESLLRHLGSLWDGTLRVAFESLLGHFLCSLCSQEHADFTTQTPLVSLSYKGGPGREFRMGKEQASYSYASKEYSSLAVLVALS